MNRRLQNSSFLLLFRFPSFFYGWIETCCPDLLHQFMSSPYSSLATDCSLGRLLSVVAFAFTLVAVVVVVMAQIALGNVVRVYPETVQGLTFYRSRIYITKTLACVTSAKSLLWSPRLVTSMK